ncbi:hypothetical protein G6F66_014169 [Rhizopus arrhizus]|nr:hypothetical protein G6F23_015123 [Rhizopus arrhizus]KAG1264996.1 hypothetical protein G6F66_014169 [Rhizopus arrhizus]
MTTKEDSELNDQEAARKEQSQWDSTQEDSEVDQTKGRTRSNRTRGSDGESDDHVHKDSLQAYLAANQDANVPRESVLHGLQERIRWDQPPEQGDMRVREPG